LPLDELPSLKQPHLAAGPESRIRVVFRDAIWTTSGSETRRDVSFSTAPKTDSTQTGIYFTTVSNVIRSMPVLGDGHFLSKLDSEDVNPALVAYGPAFAESFPTNFSPVPDKWFLPSWALGQGVVFELGTVCAIAGPQHSSPNNWKDRRLPLLFLTESAPQPIAMELQIDLSAVPDKLPPGIPVFPSVPVIVTDSHIVFTAASLPGFVKIPRTEIERSLQGAIEKARQK
jgi:hypothetical protein